MLFSTYLALFCFVVAVLLLHASVQVYRRKLEYLYNLVLHMWNRLVIEGINSQYPDKESVKVNMIADLLAAGSEGRGDEIVGILEVDLQLIRVGDLNGDTVLHFLVSGGYVKPLLQLLKFMLVKNPKLLKEVTRQGNAHGDTPSHLAAKNHHKRITKLLYKVDCNADVIKNDDGETSWQLVLNIWGWDWDRNWNHRDSLLDEEENKMQQVMYMLDEMRITRNTFNDEELPYQNESKDALGIVYEHLLNAQYYTRRHYILQASYSDIEMEMEFMETIKSVIFEVKISEMLEIDPTLIRYKNFRGQTIVHELACSGYFNGLTELVNNHGTTLSLLMESDKYGKTPLHYAINDGNMKASRYLMEVAPEAAYRVDNNGESPLYVAIKEGHDELVNYMLEIMPEASMSPAFRTSLLIPNKSSIPHAAIRFRKFTMLVMILERIPSLIDSLDEKGWKPLSYAAYKGYLNIVDYLLKKFPESVKKFDSDGSLPIHKAISGGHVRITKAFITIHPETLYSIDMKGRNVLHIAAKCPKLYQLCYLRFEVSGIEKLYNLKDNDGKTFADYYVRRSNRSLRSS